MSNSRHQLPDKAKPTNPVILIHGWSDNSFATDSLQWLERVLKQNKIPSITVRLLPYSSIHLRSEQAIEQICRAFPKQDVHLWGHSMGGLNAREIAWKSSQNHEIGFKVKSVTMLATPNEGLRIFNFLNIALFRILFKLLWHIFGIDIDGTRQLSESFIKREFNPNHLNCKEIKYFSWSGYLEYNDWKTIFAITWALTHLNGQGENDGGCPVETSKWGTHVATLKPSNHFTVLDKFVAEKSLEIMKAEEDGKEASEIDKLIREIRDQANTPERMAQRRATLIKSTFYELLFPLEVLTGYPISSCLYGGNQSSDDDW